MLTLLTSLTTKVKLTIAGVLAILLFLGGWFGHKAWVKPVERIVTVQVPVTVEGGPQKPETQHPNGTVTPGVHYGNANTLPKPPDPDPGFQPNTSTVIELPVYKPVKVFHQNSLSFKEQNEAVHVWVDTRVWAQYEDGTPVKGVHADTTFANDKELTFPVKVRIQVPPSHPWAVGAKYNLRTQDYGVWVERDIEFIRLGLDLDYAKQPLTYGMAKEIQPTLRLGFRF